MRLCFERIFMSNEFFYEISYFIIALSICLMVLLFNRTVNYREKRRHAALFKLLCLDVLICTLTNISSHTFQHLGSLRGIDVSLFFYFLVHSGLAPLFYVYIFLITGAHHTRTPRKHLLIMAPCFAMITLILLNPLTRWVYYIDKELTFHRNWAETIIYIVSGYFLLIALIHIIKYWNVMNRRRRWALLASFALVIVGVLLQLLFVKLTVELVFEALAMLGVMLTVENEDDRIDTETMTYNRDAFKMTIDGMLGIHKHFALMAIRINNADAYNRIAGTAGVGEIMRVVGDYLRERGDSIYRVTPNSYAAVTYVNDPEILKKEVEETRERFESNWKIGEVEIGLDATILCTTSDGFFTTVDDYMLLFEGQIPPNERRKVLSGQELLFLKRNVEIEKAVLRGVTNETYEVYYQPIYGNPNKSVLAAKAYLYLRDELLGLLPSRECHAAIRANNLESYLSLKLLSEVCMFIGSGIPMELGVREVGIGIAASQLIREEFVEDVIRVSQRHSVAPGQIDLEISGLSELQEYDAINRAIRILKEAGFAISIDRYGTEETNLKTLINVDYDVVNMDMSSYQPTYGTDTGHRLFRDNVDMIHKLGKIVLLKGINDVSRAKIASSTSADYLQGDFYSETIRQNEFIAVLKGMENAWREEEKARMQNEAKSSFLANMSHEIRTPINAILGMNEMILRKSTNPQILSYAGDIERAGRNLLSLINGILDFSKIESGNMELVDVDYELSALLNDVIRMFRERMDEKGLEFITDIDSMLPDMLYGDELRVKQVIINILSNAVKYTDHGSVSFSVGSQIVSADIVKLDIRITDTGKGIRKEEQSQLFGTFRRLDAVNNRTVEGTGLGLAITAGILKMMDGEVEVESEYGKGSTFRVIIPQKIISLEPIGNLEEKYKLDEKNRKRYRKSFTAKDARIMVVDDTPINLKVIRELLGSTQVEIEEALSGEECLKKLRQDPYDLVLLDYRMPVMDGIETLHRLRQMKETDNWSVPVIALTANAVSGAREHFISEGFDDYLTKPVDGAMLEEMVAKFLPPAKVHLFDKEDEGEEPYVPDPSIIKLYRDSILSNADELETYMKEQNWEDYTVKVHSLKSTTFLIGEHVLARMFKSLEEAGDAGNIDFIRTETPGALARYRELYDKLGEVLNEETNDDAEEIDEDTMQDAYDSILEFSENMDYENIGFVLNELREFKLTGEDAKTIDRIRELHGKLDYSGITEILMTRKGGVS